jgi:hypothetical protein
MSELLKSRHAFGSLANIDSALDQGLIDAYDILFLKEGKIGWIDADGQKVILEDKVGVVSVDALPETGDTEMVYIYDSKLYFWNGEEFRTPTLEGVISGEEVDVKIDTAITKAVSEVNTYTNEKIETVEKVKYEITHKPVGTLVNYGEKEIRVMCPADTEWVKQNVGTNGLANRYYITFKAYAPEGAESFKEDVKTTVEDQTMWYFENNSSAGIDMYGRKYSVVWLSVAEYDEVTDTWTYFGAESTKDNYVGKDYSVEWYDKDGIMIASDYVRINYTNEECHSSTEPYYINNAVKTAKVYTDKQIEQIVNAFAVVEF